MLQDYEVFENVIGELTDFPEADYQWKVDTESIQKILQ